MLQTSRYSLAMCVAVTLALAAGCGKKAPPAVPPAPGPQPPTLQRVEVACNRVRATFLPPTLARSGRALSGGFVGILQRRIAGKAAAWSEVRRRDFPPEQLGQRTVLFDGPEGCLAGAAYEYRVLVSDRFGQTSDASTTLPLRYAIAPGAPSELTADSTAEGLRLRWTPATADCDGGPVVRGVEYRIWRSADRNQDVPALLSLVTEPEFTDRFVRDRERFRYTVEAKAPGADATSPMTPALSAEYLDRFPPPAPIGVQAFPTRDGVLISWTPLDELAVGYIVERSADGGAWRALTAAPLTATTYLDAGADRSRRLRYRVLSLDDATPPNQSASSAEAVVEAARGF